MKRRNILIFVLIMIFLTACSSKNVEEEEKNEYLTLKSKLLESVDFKETTDFNCDIKISIDRINSEEISYRVIIDNPKENMNDIKAMVVHNYYTEDIFPSLGLFNDKESLLVGNKDVKGIELVGYIETIKDIDDLNLELKIWIEYITDNGEVKDIYYKST